MITIKAHGWQQFLAAFGVLRNAEVEPLASGGNEMRVPDDTDRTVLRAVAATGAVVHANLGEPDPEPPEPDATEAAPTPDAAPEQAETQPDETKPPVDTPPAHKPRTPRKTTTRRKTSRE